MEEQSDEACLICVEAEGIDMVHVLVDVSWEDEHIEKCKQRTNDCFLFPKEEHTESKGYLYHARCQHDKVCKAFAELKPCGYLCNKLLTCYCQMTDACVGHEKTKQQAKCCLYVFHIAIRFFGWFC